MENKRIENGIKSNEMKIEKLNTWSKTVDEFMSIWF